MTYPHHLPDPQQYAVEQERFRHDQALFAYGEYAVFCLLWKQTDRDLGLVGDCLRCVVPYGQVAAVYSQAADAKCPECFGTGLEGGFKALLVRPSLWDYTEQDIGDDRRGTVLSQSAAVQTTSDFRLRNDDYIFRSDGSRWQMRAISTNHLRTGFTGSQDENIGYNFGTVTREDESSVAYLIPPPPAVLLTLGARGAGSHAPRDHSAIEVVRGPLT